MKAELFYKNNYNQKNNCDTNHNALVSEHNKNNQDNIKIMFNASIRENIDKTYITRTTIHDEEEKANSIVFTHKNEKDNFNFNCREEISSRLYLVENTVKSGLITKRSRDSSIANILNNLDENFNNINDRIIDKIHKNKKIIGHNFSTTDKTKGDENITKMKLSQCKDEILLNNDQIRAIAQNKSSNCYFNNPTKSITQSFKQSANSEYNVTIKNNIIQQKNKMNIKLKYKDVKEMVTEKSPLHDKNNNFKVSRINEYNDINLKKGIEKKSQNYKSCDPKNYDNLNYEIYAKQPDYSGKKNNSTNFYEKQKIVSKNNYLNAKSEKNLIQPEPKLTNVLTNSRNTNYTNDAQKTNNLTIFNNKNELKKSIEKKRNEDRSITPKNSLDIKTLTNTIYFSKNTQSKSSLHSNKTILKVPNILMKKSFDLNNFLSNKSTNSNNIQSRNGSRNSKNLISKTPSNPNILNSNTIINNIKSISKEKNKPFKSEMFFEKKIYSSCINLKDNIKGNF